MDYLQMMVSEEGSTGRTMQRAGHRLSRVRPGPAMGLSWLPCHVSPDSPSCGRFNCLWSRVGKGNGRSIELVTGNTSTEVTMIACVLKADTLHHENCLDRTAAGA